MTELTDTRREVLAALCDTVVPSLERTPDPDGFFARNGFGHRRATRRWSSSSPRLPAEQQERALPSCSTHLESRGSCAPRGALESS